MLAKQTQTPIEARKKRTVYVRLKELIDEKKRRDGVAYTQESIASALGIPRSTLVRWIMQRNTGRMSGDIIAAICAYFECGIDELLEIREVDDVEQPA